MIRSRTVLPRTSEARAPGKIILTGEHFVVLGAPAVAMAINMYARATARTSPARRIRVSADIPMPMLEENGEPGPAVDSVDLLRPLRLAARETLAYIGKNAAGTNVEVQCGVPVGAGLGSSAATSVAIIAAVAHAHGEKLSKADIIKVAFGPESFLHGKPSGVDHSTCSYGGILTFTKPDRVKRISVRKVPRILVCDSGIRRSTRGLVAAVVRKSKAEKKSFESHLEEVTEISQDAVRALRRGDDEKLGDLFNRNHALLSRIGVSNPTLDKLVKAARRYGSLGAKLTGAGGGGCIIAVCGDSKNESRVSRAVSRLGGVPYEVAMDEEGVVSW